MDTKSQPNLTRRDTLKSAALVAGTLPLVLFASAPAQAKIAQTTVGYQPEAKDGHYCSNCSLFEAPSSCKTVDGTVSAVGWCKVWARKAG